jgi:dolichol-phosphate mannosyltransferase
MDHSLLELIKLSEQDLRFLHQFQWNFGHQIAVTAGLDASNGKAVVIIDGDLQDLLN